MILPTILCLAKLIPVIPYSSAYIRTVSRRAATHCTVASAHPATCSGCLHIGLRVRAFVHSGSASPSTVADLEEKEHCGKDIDITQDCLSFGFCDLAFVGIRERCSTDHCWRSHRPWTIMVMRNFFGSEVLWWLPNTHQPCMHNYACIAHWFMLK